MKRSPIKVQRPPGTRPPRVAKQVGPEYTIRPRDIAASPSPKAWFAEPVPKTVTVDHKGYRRLVAALPCIRCLRIGCQAAHPNTNKGAGYKTDDRLIFPLCADGPGRVGCHTLFDQRALYSKEVRRELEPKWGRLTREQIRSAGQWPTNLPAWADDEVIA